MRLPPSARIREVGPRDGFQNEREIIPTAEKVRLIDLLARTGVPRLEVTSFVRAEPGVARAAEHPLGARQRLLDARADVRPVVALAG